MASSAEDFLSDKPAFHPGLVRQVVRQASGEKVRITNEALVAIGELLRVFVIEARHRAGIEAECEKEGAADGKANDDKATIKPHHITRVAAELLMDFS